MHEGFAHKCDSWKTGSEHTLSLTNGGKLVVKITATNQKVDASPINSATQSDKGETEESKQEEEQPSNDSNGDKGDGSDQPKLHQNASDESELSVEAKKKPCFPMHNKFCQDVKKHHVWCCIEKAFKENLNETLLSLFDGDHDAMLKCVSRHKHNAHKHDEASCSHPESGDEDEHDENMDNLQNDTRNTEEERGCFDKSKKQCAVSSALSKKNKCVWDTLNEYCKSVPIENDTPNPQNQPQRPCKPSDPCPKRYANFMLWTNSDATMASEFVRALGHPEEQWCRVISGWPTAFIHAALRVAAHCSLQDVDLQSRQDWAVVHHAFTGPLHCGKDHCKVTPVNNQAFCTCMNATAVSHQTPDETEHRVASAIHLKLPRNFSSVCMTDRIPHIKKESMPVSRELMLGSTGADVLALQKKIAVAGQRLLPACANESIGCMMAMSQGFFDIATQVNLKAVQRAFGTCPDGIADSEVYDMLSCSDCVEDNISGRSMLFAQTSDPYMTFRTVNLGSSETTTRAERQDVARLQCALHTFSRASGGSLHKYSRPAESSFMFQEEETVKALKDFQQLYMHYQKMDKLSGIVDTDTKLCLKDMFYHDVFNNAEQLSEFNECISEAMIALDRVLEKQSALAVGNSTVSQKRYVFDGHCSSDLIRLEDDPSQIQFRGKSYKVEWTDSEAEDGSTTADELKWKVDEDDAGQSLVHLSNGRSFKNIEV